MMHSGAQTIRLCTDYTLTGRCAVDGRVCAYKISFILTSAAGLPCSGAELDGALWGWVVTFRLTGEPVS